MMHCCVCLFVRSGVAEQAVTIIRGYAVCEDHMGLAAQGQEWAAIYNAAQSDQG